jgi:type I restriction enzyme R subunit
MSRIDPRLLETARRSVNFGVLEPIEPLLALYGAGAESSVYSDPNAALIKCRQFGEVLVEQLLRRSSTRVESSRQVDRIRALEDAGVLTEVTANALHEVRKAGNDATHSYLFNVRITVNALARCFQLGMLLHRAVSGDRTVHTFVPPQPPQASAATTVEDRQQLAALDEQYQASKAELAEALTVLTAATSSRDAEAQARRQAELELERARKTQQETAAALAELQRQLAEFQDALATTAAEPVTLAGRAAFIERARRPRPLSEVAARRVIDGSCAPRAGSCRTTATPTRWPARVSPCGSSGLPRASRTTCCTWTRRSSASSRRSGRGPRWSRSRGRPAATPRGSQRTRS